MTRMFAAALALGLLAAAGAAHAAPKQHRHDSQAGRHCALTNSGRQICAGSSQRTHGLPTASYSARRHVKGDPRPRAWCGWQMRQWFGVADRAGNRARWWVHYGTTAAGPAVGVIVVWPRGRRGGHVGVITGRAEDGRWIVKSGNDGHRVRERPRSVRGAIAFRRPEQRWASR